MVEVVGRVIVDVVGRVSIQRRGGVGMSGLW